MKTRNLLALAVAAALTAACASVGTRVEESKLTQFQDGVTTESQVEQALGAPQNNTRNTDGTRSIVYVYSHAQVKGATFIPIVGMFAGGVNSNTSSVKFDFDAAGKLTGHSNSTGTMNAGTGIVSGAQQP